MRLSIRSLTDGPRRARWAAAAYLAVGGSLACAHLLLPGLGVRAAAFTLIALSGVGAIWLGIRLHRPESAVVWHMFAAGLLLFVVGDTIWSLDEVIGSPPAIVSIADAAYLAGYPPLIGAVFLLMRGRGSRQTLLDSLIVAVSLSVPMWTFAIEPSLHDEGLSASATFLLVAYPVMDVLFLAVFALLLVTPQARSAAYGGVVLAASLLLAGDLAYLLDSSGYVSGSWLDLAWLLSYVIWGAAALHPSMKGVAPSVPVEPKTLSRRRLALLGAAAMCAPGTLAAEAVVENPSAVPISLAAGVLFMLVLVRARGLIDEIETAREAVFESEQRYRTLVEQLPLIVYIDEADAASSNVFTSPQTTELLGYTPEDWLADADLFPKVLHPEDRARVLAEHQKSQEAGEPLRCEYRVIARDGKVVWVLDESVPIRELDGKVRYQGFLLDITARKEAEEMRNRLAAIVEDTDDAVFSGTSDGIIQSWNRAAERMYGYTEAEIIGKSVARLIPSDRPKEMARHVQMLKRGESVTHFETVRLRKDGTPFDVSLTLSPIFDLNGKVIGASSIQRDVTERKRAHEDLTEQTAWVELLKSVAVAANEAAKFEDAMQFALDQVCGHMGWQVGHVYLAKDGALVPTDIWHFDEPERFEAFRALTERTPFEKGVGLPGRVLESEHAVWVHTVAEDSNFPRRDTAGTVGIRGALAFPVLVGSEVVAVLEFFSLGPAEPKPALLEVMANIGAQLGRVVERTRAQRALAEQNEQLLELDRMKDDFVALVSHELRTPLTSIRGFAELLASGRAGPLDEVQEGYLDILNRNSLRLLRLVDDLLFFSQVRANRVKLGLERIDVRDVTRDVVDSAQLQAEEKGISLALSLDGPAHTLADRARLEQLLDNLLSNALKFTPEKGSVGVEVRSDGGQAVVTVSDSGVGIAPEDQEHVFKGFFRAESATAREIPGTGLGLAIADAIAEAHGGSIEVASSTGAGSTFTVRLPLAGR